MLLSLSLIFCITHTRLCDQFILFSDYTLLNERTLNNCYKLIINFHYGLSQFVLLQKNKLTLTYMVSHDYYWTDQFVIWLYNIKIFVV